SHIFKLLDGIKSVALLTYQRDAAESISELLGMTSDTIRQLNGNGQLDSILHLHFDNINNALGDWSENIGEFLERLREQLADE
ncbi:MAG TPA: hypothetical protein VF443_05045, partial [Nitrospira sp.]